MSTIVLAKGLGVQGFGEAALGASVLSIGIVASTFGADVQALQATAKDPLALSEHLGLVTAIRISLSALVLVIIAGLCACGVWTKGESLAALLFSSSLFANAVYPLWAVQALERAPAIAASTLGAQALNLILNLLAFNLRAGVAGYALAKVSSDLIVALALLAWIRLELRPSLRWPTLETTTAFLRTSAPLGVAQLWRTLALGGDLLLLSLFLPSASFGRYVIAYRVFGLMLSISSVYFTVIMPGLVRSVQAGGPALENAFRVVVGRPTIVMLCVLPFLGAAAPVVLSVSFGSEMVSSAPSFVWLLVAFVANFVTRGYRVILIAGRHSIHDMRTSRDATIFSLAAKLCLIPLFGIAGAAAGTAMAELLLAGLQRRLAKGLFRSGPPPPLDAISG